MLEMLSLSLVEYIAPSYKIGNYFLWQICFQLTFNANVDFTDSSGTECPPKISKTLSGG